MSAGIVDQITLEYLMNRDMYKKLMTNKTVIAQKNKEKDFYRNRISHLTEELLANNEVDGLFSDVSFAFENYVKTCIHYFKIIDESDIIQNDYNGAACEDEEPENENDDLALDDLDEDLDDELDQDLEEDLDQDEDDGDNEVVDFEEATNEKEEIFVEILEDEDEDEDALKEDDKMKMMMRSAKMMTGTLDKFMMLKPPAPTLTPAKKIADVLPTQKEINLEDPLLMNKGICKKKNMNNKYGK
jgi:hypothetical protein